MSQQINLLLPALRPRFDWLALPVVVSIAGGVLALVVLLALWGQWRETGLRAQESALRATQERVQAQTVALGHELSGRQGDASLPARIEALRQEIAQRREVEAWLKGGGLLPMPGFSPFLQGFSRQVLPGLWLTGFEFQGTQITLQGRLLEPALLPKYVAQLNQEPIFKGKRFGALVLRGVRPGEGEASAADTGRDSVAATPSTPAQPYTEFVLTSADTVVMERKP